MFENDSLNSGNSNSTRLSTRVRNDSEGSPIEASISSRRVTDEAIASLKARTFSLFAISGATPPSSLYISTIESSKAFSSAWGPQIDSRKMSLIVFLPVSNPGNPAAKLPAVSIALQIALPIISQTFTISFTKIDTIAF